jgi:CRISPR-associated protein Cmx8
LLKSLECEKSGYRPRDSLIDIPEEGGLEYLYQLVYGTMSKKEIKYSLKSVELYHLEKQGNNVRMHTKKQLVPNKYILEKYENIRKVFHNPFFKSVIFRNLLTNEPWYKSFKTPFNSYPSEFFTYKKGETPQYIHFFGYDVRKKFISIEDKLKKNKGGIKKMSVDDRENQLAQRVYRLVRNYVQHKSEAKSGIKYENFKNNKDDKDHVIYPEKFKEAREKICSDAFLAMRGRREQDFIEYFTGTICSVPHFLPEEEYIAVADALMSEWDKVKNLSMLAVSACSYSGGSKNNENNQEVKSQ